MPDWCEILCAIRKFLYHVSPALVGVILGGWIVQRYWIKKANEAAIISYIADELDDLVDETLHYWSIDCSGTGAKADTDRKEAARYAAKIRAASHNLNKDLRSYSEKYCKKVDFSNLVGELLDACTGGDFEVAKRQADPHRFSAVVNATHRVRWKLFERRV